MEKNNDGQDIFVDKLVESYETFGFESFNSKLYQNLPQLKVHLMHKKTKIKIPESVFCNAGGVSTPVLIDLTDAKPMADIELSV